MKFVDTGWLVAWASHRDQRHGDALSMLARCGDDERLLTTNHVIGESWTLMRKRTFHAEAVGVIDLLDALVEQRRLVVHRVSEQQERAAWEWLRRRDERVYSFVDATSFRVMTDRRLREALAFDGDFAAAGFIQVMP